MRSSITSIHATAKPVPSLACSAMSAALNSILNLSNKDFVGRNSTYARTHSGTHPFLIGALREQRVHCAGGDVNAQDFSVGERDRHQPGSDCKGWIFCLLSREATKMGICALLVLVYTYMNITYKGWEK